MNALTHGLLARAVPITIGDYREDAELPETLQESLQWLGAAYPDDFLPAGEIPPEDVSPDGRQTVLRLTPVYFKQLTGDRPTPGSAPGAAVQGRMRRGPGDRGEDRRGGPAHPRARARRPVWGE